MNKRLIFFIVAIVAILSATIIFSSMQGTTMGETTLLVDWAPLGALLGISSIIGLAAFGALRFFKKMEPERALKVSAVIFLVTAVIFLVLIVLLSTCIVDLGQCAQEL